MIESSFILLDRIGKKGEKNLWKAGILTWDDFLSAESIKGISKKAKPYYDRQLRKARQELYSCNSGYFSGLLPQSETWRLYSHFRDDAVFLDIEATGVSGKDQVFMVGLFDGINTKLMIRGINLDMNELSKELKNYKIIVTFNGASFDMPFLRKRYPCLIPDVPHIDLLPVCRRAGLSGGLKEIERQLGIKRSHILDRLYGGDVLRLWRMYRASGDPYYLDLLVEYNEDDVISLKKIAMIAIAKNKEGLFPWG